MYSKFFEKSDSGEQFLEVVKAIEEERKTRYKDCIILSTPQNFPFDLGLPYSKNFYDKQIADWRKENGAICHYQIFKVLSGYLSNELVLLTKSYAYSTLENLENALINEGIPEDVINWLIENTNQFVAFYNYQTILDNK